MNRRTAVALFAGCLLFPGAALAQDSNPVVFGTYYVCDQNREAGADAIQRGVMGPILDGHLEAGHLLAWGWLSHRIGGEWRRAEYMIAPDRATLLTVRNQVIEALQEGEAEVASRELTSICPDHDDYIWTVQASSDPDLVVTDRPAAGMSTYYVCDPAREARADQIVSETLAPIFNRHVGESALGAWSWLAHSVGGEYRRAFVIDAADEATLHTHREALVAEVQRRAAEAGAEFNAICDSHVDYQWDITISRP